MNYLAIQVPTGKEVQVAAYIKNALLSLWDLERYEFLRGMQVLHFSKAVTIVEGEKVRTTTKAELPGYIYVAFHKWDNHLYHLLKSVPGVLKLLYDKVNLTFTTQDEIDRMKVDQNCEVQIVVPDTQSNNAMIESLSEKNEKVKERQLMRNKLLRRLVTVPMEFFRNVVNKTAKNAITDSLLAAISLPDRISPLDDVKTKACTIPSNAEWLLKLICQRA